MRTEHLLLAAIAGTASLLILFVREIRKLIAQAQKSQETRIRRRDDY